MMTSRHNRRKPLALGFVGLLLVLIPGAACVGQALTAEFGFDHQFIANRYAPIQVTLSGLDSPIMGGLVVHQYVQPLTGDPVPITLEIARGRLENGVYRAAVPAYDPVLPVVVEAVDQAGQSIASTSESVRQAARGLPFVVMAGAAYHFDGTEAVVGVDDLPTDWWAYDPVESVWLASPVTDRSAWEAIGEWVTSGGSLVIFSGESFYQWDSPLARSLLPMANPRVLELDDGSSLLSGSPRVGAEILLARDDQPLMLRWQYGAGHVSLVTARFDDLSPTDLERIAARVPHARRVVASDRIAETALNQTRVLRPMYAFAPILVVLVLVGFWTFHRASRRRPRLATLVFLGFIGCLAVASGLYTNQAGQLYHQYTVSTTLQIQTSFGMSIVSYSFFSLDVTSVKIDHAIGSFPTQASFQTTRGGLTELQSSPGVSLLPIPARTRRFVRLDATSEATATLELDRDGASLRIDNVGEPVDAALLFVNGFYYDLPPIAGSVSLDVDALHSVSTSAMTPEEARIYDAVGDWITSSPGTWLLTYRQRDSLQESEGLPEKVSLIVIEAVEGVET